jgi:hypothetical protein
LQIEAVACACKDVADIVATTAPNMAVRIQFLEASILPPADGEATVKSNAHARNKKLTAGLRSRFSDSG